MFTGTITAAAGAISDITLWSGSPSTLRIISEGGWWQYDAGSSMPVSSNYGASYWAIVYSGANSVTLGTFFNQARTNLPYAVWIEYIK